MVDSLLPVDLPAFLRALVGAAPLGSALLLAATAGLGAWLKARLDRQGERLKADLNREADTIRHRQQRELADFGLFTAKRHEVYAKSFALVERLLYLTVTLDHESEEPPNYGAADRDELVRRMAKSSVPEEVRELFTKAWDRTNSSLRGEAAATVMRGGRYLDASRQVIRIWRYTDAHGLYFSTAVRQQIRGILLVYIEAGDADTFDTSTVEPMVDRLRELMRAELSGGTLHPGAPSLPAQADGEEGLLRRIVRHAMRQEAL